MATEHDQSESEPEGDPTLRPIHFFFPTITPEEAKTLDSETVAIADRRTRVMHLYRERKSMRAIAEELGLKLTTVHRDINAVMDGYHRMTAKNVKDHIAEMLSQLAHREYQIELAWAKSMGEVVETSATKRKTSNGDHDTTAIKKKHLTGNPNYSAQLLKCWEYRARLLGLLRKDDIDAANASAQTKLVAGMIPEDEV